MRSGSCQPGAFTLLELMVVILVIATLFGLAVPAYQSAQEHARKVQAKNDLTQIVTAVNAYYTEYGKYPLVTADTTITGTSNPTNADLFFTLRGVQGGANINDVANPRKIVFISPPDAKNPTSPRSGIATQVVTVTINGTPVSVPAGTFVDPWGLPYCSKVDGDYDNQLPNPYSLNAGGATLRIGIIVWSFGKDARSQSVPGPAPDKNGIANIDDVISWQ